MNTTKQLTFKDIQNIHIMSRSVSQLEKIGVSEAEIKLMIYRIGVFAYRQYHSAGIPVSTEHPLLSAPKKVWDKCSLCFIDERTVESHGEFR